MHRTSLYGPRHQKWEPPQPQILLPHPQTTDMTPPALRPAASDTWWSSLDLFKLKYLSPTGNDIWCPKQVQLASGWYACYWNAFLFEPCFFLPLTSDRGFNSYLSLLLFLSTRMRATKVIFILRYFSLSNLWV